MEDFIFNGIVLIDKPNDLTSHEAVLEVKKILNVKKAGHSGTLDKNTTGVLLIALNEATKAMPVLINLSKEYSGIMHLHDDFDPKELKKTAEQFIGKIIQTPPKKSAVSRNPRERKIFSFDITKINGRNVNFMVNCESGVYIRKLVHDFGEKIGCKAHLIKLRRLKINGFSLKDCSNLRKLNKEAIFPLEKILERTGLKKITVKNSAIKKIKNGAPLRSEWIIKANRSIEKDEIIGFYNSENKIIALGHSYFSLNKIPGRRVIAKTDRIFRC